MRMAPDRKQPCNPATAQHTCTTAGPRPAAGTVCVTYISYSTCQRGSSLVASLQGPLRAVPQPLDCPALSATGCNAAHLAQLPSRRLRCCQQPQTLCALNKAKVAGVLTETSHSQPYSTQCGSATTSLMNVAQGRTNSLWIFQNASKHYERSICTSMLLLAAILVWTPSLYLA